MTDPSLLPLAPPEPIDAGADAAEETVDPWQRRFEVLAVLLVLAVVALVISAFAAAHAQLNPGDEFIGGAGQRNGLDEVIRIAGSSAGFATAGALLVALLLVTLGPGDRITSTGRLVLGGVVAVGLTVAGLGALSAVLTIIRADDVAEGGMMIDQVVQQSFVQRLSTAAPLIASAAVSGFVAWCAFSTLGEVRFAEDEEAEVDEDDDVIDPAEPLA